MGILPILGHLLSHNSPLKESLLGLFTIDNMLNLQMRLSGEMSFSTD
jgi:hypothetical protein